MHAELSISRMEQATLSLFEWTSLFTQLEKDEDSAQTVKVLKLLSVLAEGGVEENLLLGENSEFKELGRFPVDGFAEVNHPNLHFLRRSAEWPLIVGSLSSLPFMTTTNTRDEPQQHIFSLAPEFRDWLQEKIRHDPSEDVQWAITAVLLLHRFTPSPLIKGWLSFVHKRKDAVRQDQHIHHVLQNLLRVCGTLREQDLVFLPPSQRLCCVIFYINWNGLALHSGQHDHRNQHISRPRESQYCQTTLLLEKLADTYKLNPLIQAIVKAEMFLQAGSSNSKFLQLYDEWIELAKGFIGFLETLNESGGAVSGSLLPQIAVDTLMALIFACTPLSNRNVQYRPAVYGNGFMHGNHVLTLLATKEQICQEAHRFRTRLPPPTDDYERMCAVFLSHWFYTKSRSKYKAHMGKYMQENFSFAMDFLPIPLAFVYLLDMLSCFLDGKNYFYGSQPVGSNGYCWALTEVFRIRPEIIYLEREGLMTVTEAPNNRHALNHLERVSYDLIKPLLKFPIHTHFTHIEAIAAHHFLAVGNFPKKSLEVLHTTRWAPLLYSFHVLSLIYFDAREFREAAVLANTYLSLIRVQTPLSWVPHLHRCIQILVLSLRGLGYLTHFDVSLVGRHVDTLLFDRLDHEETDIVGSTLVWKIVEPEDKAHESRYSAAWTRNEQQYGNGKKKHTVPWAPKLETTYSSDGVEESEPVNNFYDNPAFYKQMRGWFQLIDKDDAFRDARYRLLKSRSEVIERIVSADRRLGIEPETSIKADEHLFCRLLGCIEYSEHSSIESVLAEYGLRTGCYRTEGGGHRERASGLLDQ